MDLLGTVLLLVLVRSDAQNLVDVTGELGQDVTLTCSFKHGDFYWFMEVHSRIRALIGQSLSSVPTYFSTELETKYSLSGNQLTVRSLSAEDDRMYFCGKKEDGRTVYGDPIRLIVSVFPVTRPTSPSVQLNFSPSPSCSCESEKLTFIIYRSAVILSFLLSLTALLCFTGRGRGWSRRMKLVQSAQ